LQLPLGTGNIFKKENTMQNKTTPKTTRRSKKSTAGSEFYTTAKEALDAANHDYPVCPETYYNQAKFIGANSPGQVREHILFIMLRNIFVQVDQSNDGLHLIRIQENIFNSTYKV
jgi:hypothetical protein